MENERKSKMKKINIDRINKKYGKDMNLTKKISWILSILLGAIFTVFIIMVIVFFSKAIISTTSNQLEAISETSAVKIQNIMNTSENYANDVAEYIKRAKTKENQILQKNEKYNEQVFPSITFPELKITGLQSKLEDYIYSTMDRAVESSEELIGMAVLFEPYQFSPDIKSYSMYIALDNNNKPILSTLGEYEKYSLEGYWKKAVEVKETVFTEPFIFNVNGQDVLMITVATPIIVDGVQIGIVTSDINIDYFNVAMSSSKALKSLGVSIFMEDGTIAYDSKDKTSIGKNMTEFLRNDHDRNKALEGMATKEAFTMKCRTLKGRTTYRFYYPIKAANKCWYAMSSVNSSDITAKVKITVVVLLLLSVAGLAVLLYVMSTLLKKMLKPIETIVIAADSIGTGNLDINLEVVSNDEISILSRRFNETAKALKVMITDIAEVLNAVANNNLNVNPSAQYNGEFIQIQKSVENIVSNLNSVMENIYESAEQVASGSAEVAGGATKLAQGASEQANVINEFIGSVKALSDNITNGMAQIKNTRDVSIETTNNAANGSDYMKKMVEAMGNIDASSKEISQITKVIDSIATQTNLLALNAAIESARAGEAGKGFSVVANEIRELANKSSEAVKDITELITNSLERVEEGKLIVNNTCVELDKIVDSAKKTSEVAEIILESSKEQVTLLSELSEGTGQISTVVEMISSTSEESAAVSEQLSAQAEALKELIGTFELKKDRS